MNAIEARGLRKTFSIAKKAGRLRRKRVEVAAVDGIDLTVEAGDMIGYIGPNGAGKSTTLKMFTGVLTPSGGELRVCGLRPVPDRIRLAYRIGVVFGQRSQLWWDLPLRESFTLLRHIYRVPATSARCWTRRSASSRSASGCGRRWRPRCCTSRRCCSWTSRPSASTW
jgi:ABC-2 type transport system ATP-binding protein